MKLFDGATIFDETDEAAVEPFRVTPGFVLFLAMLLAPAFLALAVYFGAWMVSSEVYAAQREPTDTSTQQGFAVAREGDKEVSGWKRTLVSICPAH